MAEGFFTDDEKQAQQTAYENMLIARYEAHQPLTLEDRKDARRILRAREEKKTRGFDEAGRRYAP